MTIPTLEELLNSEALTVEEKIAALKEKTIYIPKWYGCGGLQEQFDPTRHPVMNKQRYPDEIVDNRIVPVSRVTVDLPRLAVKRMTELCCGIPIKRVYKPENDKQKEIAKYIEAIYKRNRINSVNVERLNMLFGGCEVLTLWYAVEQPNNIYGFDSPLKLRCRNFSPMLGDELCPLFDEYGDLISVSIGYTRKVGRKTVRYLDAFTAAQHIKYSNSNDAWAETENEKTTIGKIPAIYAFRPTPIWENTAESIVYEIEWTLSRDGNFLRKNSKPLFVVFADEVIKYGDSKDSDREFLSVMQFPKGSQAQYVTWDQAVENLKFYVNELRSLFFTQLQLPDWSYEKMSQQALSGESRKQLFIDAQMKVHDESGRLLEFFDRETNVIKAFLKVMLPSSYHDDIDALEVESKITPFSINDLKESVDTLQAANGGKPIMSQRESIQEFGYSDNVDQTMQEINEENKLDLFALSE